MGAPATVPARLRLEIIPAGTPAGEAATTGAAVTPLWYTRGVDVRKRAALQVAVAASLWGTWSIFLRWSGLPGLTSAAVLMTVLAFAGLPAQWRHRKRVRPRTVWPWMLLFGVLDSGNTGFFFLAIASGPVAIATLSHYLAPVLTPLTAYLLLRERPTSRTYVAAVIGLAGLALLLWPSPGVAGARVLAVTAALGAASAVFYATLVPLGKKLAPFFSPLEVQGIHSYVSAALLWLVAAHTVPAPLAILKLLVGACLCGVIAGALLYDGIRYIPAGTAAVLTYLEPVVATAVGALVFHEAVGPTALLGAALVLGGGVYLAAERRESGSAPPLADQV